MKKSKNPSSGTHILSRLTSYAYGTETLPNLEDARRILLEEKIDTQEIKSWAQESLKGAKLRQKLAQASLDHQAMSKKFATIRSQVLEHVEGMRERIMERLQVLKNSSPDAAQVYCRKFEQTPDEDLPDLEAELMLLEEWDEKDEK